MQCAMKVTFTRDFPGLGERIKEAIKVSGKSAPQVAAMIGISASQLNRIGNEKLESLPEETLRAIELAMGVDFGVEIQVNPLTED